MASKIVPSERQGTVVRAQRLFAVVGVAAVCVGGLVAPSQAGQVTHDGIVHVDPENWTPHVSDGRVRQVARVGDTFVGVGKFTSVRKGGTATQIPRTNIFAWDTNGDISTTFVPNIPAEIFDVLPAGDGDVYVAGMFTNVNGAARTNRVARIDVATGAVVASFRSPGFNNRVTDIHLANGKLYVGGWFSEVGGQPRTALAALDPSTGADTGSVALTFTDTWNGGTVGLSKFAMTPDGSRLVAVGNFRNVNGQSRPQIAMVDTSGSNAQLTDWATTRFTTTCSARFETYLNAVDISPDGQYFVVVTTGAYSGGPNSGTLCDTASRWEVNRSGPGQQPTWVDYTGGDTLTAVEITGAAIYVGGHQRWMNNPFAADRLGPGGVARSGIAALDPANGLPFSWNPGRQRGSGVWGMLTTQEGLWISHDSANLGGEPRQRLAFLSLADGTQLPANDTGSLPGEVYLAGGAGGSGSPVLYRVNAGGAAVVSLDGGPDWAADSSTTPSPFHNTGGSVASYTGTIGRAATVPASTPQAIFSTERWDGPAVPEMSWDFPTPVGMPLEVRLYFANNCTCTDSPGERTFRVDIDGQTQLPTYDIVAEVGHRVGTMKSFAVTSDGNVDIDFGHLVENPLINGIEIVRTDVGSTSVSNGVQGRDFSGSEVSMPRTIDAGGQAWNSVRGAFMVDDTLYTGWSNGQLLARSFDGSTFGAPVTVNLNGLTAFANELPNITGMFFDKATGRLYFTMVGQSQLFYRYFTSESRIVGGQRFNGPANVAGIDWRDVNGMFFAGGRLYFGSAATGELRSVAWANNAPVDGTLTRHSGPGIDGFDWRSRGTFLFSGS
jgi:hypothetical protein